MSRGDLGRDLMEEESPPVLVHVGYHKTATTWLQRIYFPEHPGIHMPFNRTRLSRAIARPHPFAFDAERARNTLMEGIGKAPDDSVVVLSNERFTGNPAAGGIDAFDIVDRLAGTLPEAKVWMCVREQSAAIASYYNQFVKQGATCTVEEFLRGDRPHKRIPYFTPDYFHYLPLIRRFQAAFGQDRVLVTTFEAFREDHDSVLDEVGRFTGFDHDPAVASGAGRENASLSDRAIRVLRVLNGVFVHPDSHDHFRPLVRLPGKYLLRRFIRAVDPVLGSRRRTIRSQVMRALGDRFAASNRALGEHLGKDLSRWGYVTEAA